MFLNIIQTGGKAEASWGGPLRKCTFGGDLNRKATFYISGQTHKMKLSIHHAGWKWAKSLLKFVDDFSVQMLTEICRPLFRMNPYKNCWFFSRIDLY